MGMFFQDGLTGSAWGDWALYTDSPLRSGKFSPGWSTLPDFVKPKSGLEGQLGEQAPVGFWDPAGFTSEGDAYEFRRRRVVELKHGRVSMLACMGYITPEYFKFPGYLSPKMGLKFEDIPNGLAALTKVPGVGWGQIAAMIGTYELIIYKNTTGEPGNYGAGNLGLGILGPVKDPAVRQRKLNAEIANGRLAMMAITGMMFQNGYLGSTGPEMWFPSSAFEKELGVQAPVGYFDPLGLTKDGDAKKFARFRASEIKHGRVAMIATIGYIVPEYYKFPGVISTSSGLKFADIPNGLGAISKVPELGWAQMIGFAGFLELVYNTPYGEPGNYGKGLFGLGSLGFSASVQDPDTRNKKLNSELANGRLAMMAIMGMFFQDGLTGSAWGDWALYTDSPLR
mmetsp:Transcript_53630/g.157884  ORF Transcript_53630/g.157884 Transcript_53630/m.157884 type:complete len:396 (-) Transcript_53630:208-1395(-)